jgi:putative colanic acid biosynthesis UDP-glucose lipid carrier transferase
MMNISGRIVKRGMDLGLSLVLIGGVLSWLLPVLAFLVVIDSRGPVFFIQQRRKKGSGSFGCIKLRTMRINPDGDTRIALGGDERITRVGRWLRDTHLDELPQLFNVLWGDMSLVGPRPYMLQEDSLYGRILKNYAGRALVKPGITGMAQAAGLFGATGDLSDMEKRLRLDLLYVQSWSPALDLQILAATLRFLKRKPS